MLASELEDLAPAEQGALLAALWDTRTDALTLLQRLHHPMHHEERVLAYRKVEKTTQSAKRRTILALVQRTASPLPANIEAVHPSWIRHALDRQPTPVIRVVVATLPMGMRQLLGHEADNASPDAIIPRWLRWVVCRHALGWIEPMASTLPAPEPPQPPQPMAPPFAPQQARLWRLEAQHLRPYLEEMGLLLLASLLRSAHDPWLTSHTLQSLPQPLRSRLNQTLKEPALNTPTKMGWLDATALDAFVATAALDISVQDRLCSLGLCCVLPDLRPHAQRQLAQRLPRPLALAALNMVQTTAPQATTDQDGQAQHDTEKPVAAMAVLRELSFGGLRSCP